MLKWIGTVLFQAEGDEVGRFLSLCRSGGLNVKQFEKNGSTCRGYLSPREYKQASSLGKSVGVRLRIEKKIGIPFLLYRYRKRLGLFIGAAAAVGVLMFLQCFVWAIDVSGNEQITDTHILATAEKYGLKKGLFLPKADLEKIELDMMGDLPTLSFLSLNRIGSRVEIELSEESPKPFIIPGDEPCNIVSSKTAQIAETEVYAGQKMVKLGDVVYEGDLLVSGVVESADGKTTYHHASAKILAQTNFVKEFSVALNQEEKNYTGKEKKRYRIDICGKKLPLFIATSIHAPHDSKKEMDTLRFFGIPLPIGLETETISFYEVHSVSFTEEQALELIEKNIEIYEQEELKDAEILSKEVSASLDGELFRAEVRYQCLEDIAIAQKIDADVDPTIPRNP